MNEFCRFGFIEIYSVGNAYYYLQEWHSSRQLFCKLVTSSGVGTDPEKNRRSPWGGDWNVNSMRLWSTAIMRQLGQRWCVTGMADLSVVVCCSDFRASVLDSHTAEVLALWKGLSWIEVMRFDNMMVESVSYKEKSNFWLKNKCAINSCSKNFT